MILQGEVNLIGSKYYILKTVMESALYSVPHIFKCIVRAEVR